MGGGAASGPTAALIVQPGASYQQGVPHSGQVGLDQGAHRLRVARRAPLLCGIRHPYHLVGYGIDFSGGRLIGEHGHTAVDLKRIARDHPHPQARGQGNPYLSLPHPCGTQDTDDYARRHDLTRHLSSPRADAP